MTEAEISAGNKRLAKIDGTLPYCPYHNDLNALTRVEQKIRDKYPKKNLWFISESRTKDEMELDNSEHPEPFCAQCGGDEPEYPITVYAETEPLARFESALKVLDILEKGEK